MVYLFASVATENIRTQGVVFKNNDDNRITYRDAFSLCLSAESDGFHDLPLMERVIAFLVIFSTNFAIQSYPIDNGFSVKFNPLSPKEELRPRKFGAVFGKIPQDFNQQEEERREALIKAHFPKKQKEAKGYSNQVAKLLFPRRREVVYTTDADDDSKNSSKEWSNDVNFLNLPVVRQRYDNYRVLVAVAPPNMRFGADNKQTIIYVVFPNDGAPDSGEYSMPTVYFVNESAENPRVKKEPAEPIFIVDSNRTVTGIKSKEISKYVKFNNKWTNRHSYNVDR